jgi:molybdenum cofactor cytidylyltransferase
VTIAAVVLAAGRSSRYRAAGGAEASKLVAMLDGKPLVRHVVEAALASSARPVVVVTGHAREAVEAALETLPVTFAHNADFASGLASSLKAGIAALPGGVAGALILLGDMPGVGPALLDRLIGAFTDNPNALAAAPVHAGRPGNPVLLASALFPEIARLEGDEGARRLIAEADSGNETGLSRVIEVAADSDAVTLDVDTPEALAAARKLAP